MENYIEHAEGYIELLDILIKIASEEVENEDVQYAIDLAHLVAHRDGAKTVLQQLRVVV